MPVHLMESLDIKLEKGRASINLDTPTQEQIFQARAETACLTSGEAREERQELLLVAATQIRGNVSTVSVYGGGSWVVLIDGAPIGRVGGGRGKMRKAQLLVDEHFKMRAARLDALDHRLSVGDRQEVLSAEAALDQLTPSEARRLISMYLSKLERRGK